MLLFYFLVFLVLCSFAQGGAPTETIGASFIVVDLALCECQCPLTNITVMASLIFCQHAGGNSTVNSKRYAFPCSPLSLIAMFNLLMQIASAAAGP